MSSTFLYSHFLCDGVYTCTCTVSAAKSIIHQKTPPPPLPHSNSSSSPRPQVRRSLSPSYMRPTVSSSAPTAPTSPPASMLFETYTENEHNNEKSNAIIDNAVRIARLRVKEYNQKIRSLSVDEKASKSKELDPNEIDPYDPMSPLPQPYQRDIKRNYMSNTMVLPKPKPKPVTRLASASPTRSSSSPTGSPKVNAKNRKNVRVPSVHDVHEGDSGDEFNCDIDDKGVDSAHYEARGRSRHREVKGSQKKGPHKVSESSGSKASPIRKQDSISPETVFRNHKTLNKVMKEGPQSHQPGYDIHILNTRTRSRHNSFSFEDISPSPTAGGGPAAGTWPHIKDRRNSVDDSLNTQSTRTAIKQRPSQQHQDSGTQQHRKQNSHTSPPPRTISTASHNSLHDLSLMTQKLSPVRDHLLSPQQRLRRRPPISPLNSAASQQPSVPAPPAGPGHSSTEASRRSRSSHGEVSHSQRTSVTSKSRSHSAGAASRGNHYVSAASSLTPDDTRKVESRNVEGGNSAPGSAVSASFHYEFDEVSFEMNNPLKPMGDDEDPLYEYSVTDVPETSSQAGSLSDNRRQSRGSVQTNGYVTEGEHSKHSTGHHSTQSYHQSNRSIYDIMQADYRTRGGGRGAGRDFEPDAVNGLSDAYVSPYSQSRISTRRRSKGSRSADGRIGSSRSDEGGRMVHPYTRNQEVQERRLNRNREVASEGYEERGRDRNKSDIERGRSGSNNQSDHDRRRSRPRDGGRSPEMRQGQHLSSHQRRQSVPNARRGREVENGVRRSHGDKINGYGEVDSDDPATPYANVTSGRPRRSQGDNSGQKSHRQSRHQRNGSGGTNEYHTANVRHTERQRLAEALLKQEQASEGLGLDSMIPPGRSYDTHESVEDGFGIKQFQQQQRNQQQQQQQQQQYSTNYDDDKRIRQSTSDLPSGNFGYSRTKTPDSYYLQRKSMSVVDTKPVKMTTTSNNGNNSNKLNYRYRQKPMSKAQYQLIFGKLDDVRSSKSSHWTRSLRR